VGAVLAFIPKRLLFAVLAAAAGAAAIWGVFLYGKHEGRQAAAVEALEQSVTVLRQRNKIDEAISSADAARLCTDFGLSDDETAECVRRLGSPTP
jgi:hypothetical protein